MVEENSRRNKGYKCIPDDWEQTEKQSFLNVQDA